MGGVRWMSDLRTIAEAAELLVSRREDDGLSSATWFPHQRHLFESTKPEAWILGGNRSGKSDGLSGLGSAFLRFGNPDPRPAYCGGGIVMYDRAVRVWAISLTRDMSRDIIQAKMFSNGARVDPRPPFIPDAEIASWNVTNQTLRLKNGSICHFKACEQGRDFFQGADIDLALFDEVPDKDVYDEVTIRVGGGRRLLIRGAATILPPAGQRGGISWMFEATVDPWLRLGVNGDERNAASKDIDIYTAGIRDNPTISEDEIRRLERKWPPGSPEHRIRILGQLLPTIGGSLVYPGFAEGFHVNPALAPVVDGIRRPLIIPHMPLVLSVDFNPENGVWLVGQKVNRTFRVVDEITMEHSDIASMTHEFRMRYPAHAAELLIFGDATGRRREAQTGESSFHLIAQYMSGYPVPIRFMLPSVNPPVKDRVDTVNLHLRSPDGMRLVELAPHCTETIADLKFSKYKASGKVDKRGSRRSDGADCLGYWIVGASPSRSFGASTSPLRSIKSPGYGTQHKGARRNTPVRIAGRWYGVPA